MSKIDFKVPGRFKISEIDKQEIERIFGVEEHSHFPGEDLILGHKYGRQKEYQGMHVP